MSVYRIEYRSGMSFSPEQVTAAYWDLDDDRRWFDFYSSAEDDGYICKTVCSELVKSITRVDVTAEPAA